MEEEEEEDEPCYTTMQEIGRGPGLIFGAACCYLAGRQGAGPAPEPPEPDQGERGSWKVTSQPLERERERERDLLDPSSVITGNPPLLLLDPSSFILDPTRSLMTGSQELHT